MSPNFNPHQPNSASAKTPPPPAQTPQPSQVAAPQQPGNLINNADRPGPQPIQDARQPERTLYSRDDFSANPNPASAFGSTMPDPFHRNDNASTPPPPAPPVYPVSNVAGPNQPVVVPDKFGQQEQAFEAARNGQVQEYAPTEIYTGAYSQIAPTAAPVASHQAPVPQPLNQAGDPYTGQYSQIEMTPEAKSYLDKITPAPAVKKTGLAGFLSGKGLWIALAGVVAIIFFIGAAIFNNANSPAGAYKLASTRLTNLQTLVDYGIKNSASIDTATSKTAYELNSTLMSRVPEFNDVMTGAGVKAPDKNFIAANTDATVITNLDSAKASGTLSSAYEPELEKALTSTKEALDALYKDNVGEKTQTELLTIYKQLSELESRLPTQTAAQ